MAKKTQAQAQPQQQHALMLAMYHADRAGQTGRQEGVSARVAMLHFAAQFDTAEQFRAACLTEEQWIRSDDGAQALKAAGIAITRNKRNGLLNLPRSWSVNKSRMIAVMLTQPRADVVAAAKSDDPAKALSGLLAATKQAKQAEAEQDARQTGKLHKAESLQVTQLLSELDSDRVALAKAEDAQGLEQLRLALERVRQTMAGAVAEARKVNADATKAALPTPDATTAKAAQAPQAATA